MEGQGRIISLVPRPMCPACLWVASAAQQHVMGEQKEARRSELKGSREVAKCSAEAQRKTGNGILLSESCCKRLTSVELKQGRL